MRGSDAQSMQTLTKGNASTVSVTNIAHSQDQLRHRGGSNRDEDGITVGQSHIMEIHDKSIDSASGKTFTVRDD